MIKHYLREVIFTLILLFFSAIIFSNNLNKDSLELTIDNPTIHFVDSVLLVNPEIKLLRLVFFKDVDQFKIVKSISKFQNLKYLSITGYKLSFLPDEIGNLSNLEEIDLRGNKFDKIPFVLSKLPNLKTILLSQNCIKYPPDSGFSLKKLVRLDLCNNNLGNLSYQNFNSFFQDSNFFPNLESLVLSDNNLSYLPENIKYFKKIDYIFLFNNNFCKFPSQLLQLSNIKTIAIDFTSDLRECLINDDNFLNSFKNNTNLMIGKTYSFDQELYKLLQAKFRGKIIFIFC